MKLKMKRILALLLALVVVLTLASCGGNNGQGEQGDAGGSDTAARTDLTVKLGPITTYDPFEAYSSDQHIVMNALYATLLRIGYVDGEPQCVGVLADSWEQEEDGLVWVFHLNEDATFSNGEPITPEDVKFSLEMSKASPYQASYTGMIEEIEIRDEHTVALRVSDYDNSLPWVWNYTYVVDQESYEADPAAYAKSPVASGPYTVENLDEATGNMVLQCREDYWGEMPGIETVNIRIIADIDTALIALEGGEVDVMAVNAQYVDQLSGNEAVTLTEQPNNGMGGLFFNCQVEPWNNVKIRQAAAYAVDYEAVRNFMYAGHVSSESTVPYNSTVDPLPEGISEYTYDVEKAKELVAESGLPTPIDGGAIIGGDGGLGELLQQYLAAVGINIELMEISGNDYVNALVGSEFSLAVIPGASSAVRGSSLISNNFSSTGSFNYALYSNPEVDALAAELTSLQDEAAYQEKLKEAVSIVAEEAPVISFGCMQYYIGHTSGLHVPACLNAELYIPGCYWA